MIDEIEQPLEADGPVDAVHIDAHGAGLTTQLGDLNGDYFARMRRHVGDVPIVATLDLLWRQRADASDEQSNRPPLRRDGRERLRDASVRALAAHHHDELITWGTMA